MAIEIFCCYARKDQAFLIELKEHLIPLQRQGLITIWADTDIDAGIEWEPEIDKHLNTADIILLLVSPDFMDSDYCYSKEMKRAMERHARGEARVIPIILRPVYWQDAPFGKIQALPKDAKPITSWQDKDEAFLNVVVSIRNIVKKLMTKDSPIGTKTVEQLSESKSPKRYALLSNTQTFEMQNTPTSVTTSAEPLGNSTTTSPRTKPYLEVKQFMKQFKSLSVPRKNAYIGAAGTIIAAILLGAVIGGAFLWRSTASNQSPPTSTISHTSTPIETATATPTPCLVRCVLYHADWSKGLVGWKGGSQWSVNSDGILVRNGTDQNIKFLIAPYQPKTANYAVEAQIQFLKPFISSADPTLFGVRLRGGEYADVDGYDFYIYKDTARIRVALDPDAQVLETKPYHLDTSWHTYRIEANNTILTCYIDNVQVLQVSDYNHTQPGLVGLFNINSQINVRNFTVFSL